MWWLCKTTKKAELLSQITELELATEDPSITEAQYKLQKNDSDKDKTTNSFIDHTIPFV